MEIEHAVEWIFHTESLNISHLLCVALWNEQKKKPQQAFLIWYSVEYRMKREKKMCATFCAPFPFSNSHLLMTKRKKSHT